jgi:hypothetical protein
VGVVLQLCEKKERAAVTGGPFMRPLSRFGAARVLEKMCPSAVVRCELRFSANLRILSQLQVIT